MPNWAMNHLEVTGTKKSIHRFHERCFKDGKFEFNNLVPMPEHLKQIEHTAQGMQPLHDALAGRKPKGGWDWYTWSIAHWGTKWDIMEIFNFDNYGIGLSFSFDTAWSPPIEWVRAASNKFPSLMFTLRYGEPGMCFAGEYTACKNDMIDDNNDFPEGSDDYKELVGEYDEEEDN